MELKLLLAAKCVFPDAPIPFDADFFTDLGGHSLLAARFVGVARETPTLARITLQDLYTHRTLRALARHLSGGAEFDLTPRDLSFEPPPLLCRSTLRPRAGGRPALPAFGDHRAMARRLHLLSADHQRRRDASDRNAHAARRLRLRQFRDHRHFDWRQMARDRPHQARALSSRGVYYYRWWLSQRLISLTHAKWFQVSPLMNFYLRALGANIGKDALISEFDAGAIDLVTIGAGASLGGKLKLSNARVEGNELIIGPIEIGADAYVGSSCAIEEGVVIEDGAALEDLTSLPDGARVGAHETWAGSPARRVGVVDKAELDPQVEPSPLRRTVMTFLFAVFALVIPPIGLLPIFPAFFLFDRTEAAARRARRRLNGTTSCFRSRG